jgi:hypothetical protein
LLLLDKPQGSTKFESVIGSRRESGRAIVLVIAVCGLFLIGVLGDARAKVPGKQTASP